MFVFLSIICYSKEKTFYSLYLFCTWASKISYNTVLELQKFYTKAFQCNRRTFWMQEQISSSPSFIMAPLFKFRFDKPCIIKNMASKWLHIPPHACQGVGALYENLLLYPKRNMSTCFYLPYGKKITQPLHLMRKYKLLLHNHLTQTNNFLGQRIHHTIKML